VNPKHALVLGAGFRGLAAAHRLIDLGLEVTVLERGPHAGGVMNGLEWDAFLLDLGCHLFDNTDREMTDFVVSMAGGAHLFHSVDVRYGTVFAGELTEGLAVPDLQALPEDAAARILSDFIRALAAESDVAAPETLDACIRSRFGSEAGRYLNAMAAKVYASNCDELDACAIDIGLFKRIRFLPDRSSSVLKQIPEADARLAVSSAARPLAHYPNASPDFGRNFYPSQGGMRGFVRAAGDHLLKRGGRVHTGVGDIELSVTHRSIAVQTESTGSIEGALVVSALAPEVLEQSLLGTTRLRNLIRPVPMVLFYFKAAAADLTGMSYVHLFDTDCDSFRISAPGLYGRQADEHGRTYICVECPTTMSSRLWEDTEAHIEAVWDEVLLAGIVRPGARPSASRVLKTPKSYSVPLAGYAVAEAGVAAELAEATPQLFNLSSLAFSKLAILGDITTGLSQIIESLE